MINFYRILKYIIPLLLLIFIIYGYFWLRGFDLRRTEPSTAITGSNLFFLETNDIKSLTDEVISGNSVWEELKVIPEISESDSFIRSLANLSLQDERIKRLLSGRTFISINKTPNDKIALVLVVPQTQKIREKHIISPLMGTGKVEKIDRKKYEGGIILDVQFTSGSGMRNIFIGMKRGLLIASLSQALVEETIHLLEEGGNTEPVSYYSTLKNTAAANASANAFVDFSSLDNFIDLFTLNPESDIKAFGASSAVDFEIRKDYLALNGFIITDDSVANSLSIISGQVPSVMTLPDFIPSSATMFFQLNFDGAASFFRNQHGLAVWEPDTEKSVNIRKVHSIDIRSFFEEVTGGEFGMVMLNHKNRPAKFFIAEVKSGSQALQKLEDGIKLWASSNNTKISDFRFHRKIDDQKGIEIYRLPLGGIPEMVFGRIFNGVNGDYFTVYMNYLIFGNSVEEVGDFAYQLILGSNISGTENFKKIQNNILSRSSIFIYLDPYKTAGLFPDKMKSEVAGFLQEHSDALEKINTLTLQINTADTLYYSRMFLQYSERLNEYVNTVWMSRLDSTNLIKPAIVTNHTSGDKEIMVQDAKYQLYLISNAGRILWKIPLDGPVMSEIYQIDYYRNGRLQYLFNTKNRIYLIDRNGNPVEKYPVVLRSPATNGMSLFDYDQNGNLRIGIACENRQLYMYDREGKVVAGWKPAATDYIVEKPMQHFRFDRKDFIVATDKYKTYIYDRQGRIRVNPVRQYPVSMNNSFYMDLSGGTQKARLVSTDTLGNILYIYFSGNAGIEKRDEISSRHFFALSDLNGNGSFEHVFIAENMLRVKRANGQLIFEKEFDEKIVHKPVIYEFSRNDKKIGITLENEGKLYLFNSDGSLYTGFPLQGSSLFSISSFPGLKDRFNLIVGNKDNFLYNYSVK